MRFQWILISGLLFCVIWTDLSGLEDVDQFDSSLAEGLEAAGKHQTPLLVYFWATWCAPCKELDEVLEQGQVQKLLTGLACVRLNYDRERRHVRRFRVETLPAILVLDEKGAEITRWVGIFPEEKFYQRLHNLKTGYPLYLSVRERRDQTDLLTLGTPRGVLDPTNLFTRGLCPPPLTGWNRKQETFFFRGWRVPNDR